MNKMSSSSSNDPEDPWCDPANPRVVDFEQISAAAYKIRDGIVRTPCDVSTFLQVQEYQTQLCHSNTASGIRSVVEILFISFEKFLLQFLSCLAAQQL